MENQAFPPFVTFDNDTNTISMKPNKPNYSGMTYYFSVVLKEQNSDFMMNIYYMTIIIGGDPYVPDNSTITKELIYMNVSYINEDSTGAFNFSLPVNMTYITENFSKLFSYYVIDVAQNNDTIPEFEITEIVDNQTFKFQAKFWKPYLYGLLNKRSDWMTFEAYNTTMLVLNATGQDFGSNTTRLRIPMQFDWRGNHPTYYSYFNHVFEYI